MRLFIIACVLAAACASGLRDEPITVRRHSTEFVRVRRNTDKGEDWARKVQEKLVGGLKDQISEIKKQNLSEHAEVFKQDLERLTKDAIENFQIIKSDLHELFAINKTNTRRKRSIYSSSEDDSDSDSMMDLRKKTLRAMQALERKKVQLQIQLHTLNVKDKNVERFQKIKPKAEWNRRRERRNAPAKDKTMDAESIVNAIRDIKMLTKRAVDIQKDFKVNSILEAQKSARRRR